MRTYKYGSRALGHEPRTTVKQLIWLGLKSPDLSSRGDTIPLSLVDRNKARRFISTESQRVVENEEQRIERSDLIHELQVMLLLNRKAEIPDTGDLTDWLNGALSQRMDA